jgi:uncharacterized protein YmfQ (DUF2313 family)
MLRYAPPFLQNSRVYRAIIGAEGAEYDAQRTTAADILKQFYIETATEWGLAKWEEFLGLASYAGKPLSQRRSRIISKLRGIGSVTVEMIETVAGAFENGTIKVTEQPELYQFTISFISTRGIPPNIEDLFQAIEEIKPAHLAVVYDYKYLTWNELDAMNLTWDQLDAMHLTWEQLAVLDPANPPEPVEETMLLTGCESS